MVHRPHPSGWCGEVGLPRVGLLVSEDTPLLWPQRPPEGSPVPETQRSVLLGLALDRLKLSPACLVGLLPGGWLAGQRLPLVWSATLGQLTLSVPRGPLHTGDLLCMESTSWGSVLGQVEVEHLAPGSVAAGLPSTVHGHGPRPPGALHEASARAVSLALPSEERK